MQRLRRLARRRSSRTEEGVFLIDGPLLLAEALRAGMTVSSVFAEPGAIEEPLDAAVASGAERHLVHDGVLRKVLDVANPQSVVAVAAQPVHSLDAILQAAQKTDSLVLGLVGVQDPGNAGTLIRVAEAAGCAGVVLTVGSVELWNPKTVRASAGALFRVPVVSGVEAVELIEAAGRVRLGCIATVARGASAPEDCALGSAALLLVGAESQGLPPAVVELAGEMVSIPMAGEVESLNAAVAGAVLAFEGMRQRRVTAPRSPGSAEPGIGTGQRDGNGVA